MHDFTVLALPGSFATSVCATLDMLRAAATLAPRVPCAVPRWRVVTTGDDTRVVLGNGMAVEARRLPVRARTEGSTWIVPGLGAETVRGLDARLASPAGQRAIEALRRHAAAGGAVAAGCSAVFLLQAAGLLPGRRVTTSWWLASELRRREPACTVAADRMVCADGPVLTGGAAFAQADLMLALLQARFGTKLVDRLRRVLLVDARQAQAPYAVPALLANGDALVAKLTARLEAALPQPPSVRALADEFAMSERTMARRVRAATGMTPLALLQSVRLNRARVLIESSRMPIDRVAAEVGYGDATALRRLMRRHAGANPSSFRVQVG